MFRGLIRFVLIAVVVVAAGFFIFGYWSGERFEAAPVTADAETPRIDIDTAAAREAAADMRETTANAAARISESLEEGSLTGKIKAKMVLDDLVKARAINVTTDGTVVTLAGTVHTQEERDRALALAKETDGVTNVIDALVIR